MLIIRDFWSFLKLLATNIDLDTFFHIILSSDPIVVKYNFTKGFQFIDSSSFLFFDSRIFIPSSHNFHTYILQYNQDHILTSHFSQNKILELIYYKEIQFFIISIQVYPFYHRFYSHFYDSYYFTKYYNLSPSVKTKVYSYIEQYKKVGLYTPNLF